MQGPKEIISSTESHSSEQQHTADEEPFNGPRISKLAKTSNNHQRDISKEQQKTLEPPSRIIENSHRFVIKPASAITTSPKSPSAIKSPTKTNLNSKTTSASNLPQNVTLKIQGQPLQPVTQQSRATMINSSMVIRPLTSINKITTEKENSNPQTSSFELKGTKFVIKQSSPNAKEDDTAKITAGMKMKQVATSADMTRRPNVKTVLTYRF